MPDMAKTSVRINGSATQILSGLAAKLGLPKAQIIEIPLRQLEERTFWADVNRAFEHQAASSETEIGLWDRSSQRDFHNEKWD